MTPEIEGRLRWVRTILQDTAAYAQRIGDPALLPNETALVMFAIEVADSTLQAAGVGDWHGELGDEECGEYRWEGKFGCERTWRVGQ